MTYRFPSLWLTMEKELPLPTTNQHPRTTSHIRCHNYTGRLSPLVPPKHLIITSSHTVRIPSMISIPIISPVHPNNSTPQCKHPPRVYNIKKTKPTRYSVASYKTGPFPTQPSSEKKNAREWGGRGPSFLPFLTEYVQDGISRTQGFFFFFSPFLVSSRRHTNHTTVDRYCTT